MNPPTPAARLLEQVLLLNLAVHLLAMLSMLLLLPGLPGGTATDLGERAAYVAAYPWLWRLGWLPWQLTAAVDVLTGIALCRTPWVPRLPAVLTLLITLTAVVPDQTGEGRWVLRGPAIAAQALEAGDPAAYGDFEAEVFTLVAAWGGSLYLLMALGWTWCFAAAGTWSRGLTVLSAAAWGLLAVGSAGLLLPAGLRPGPLLVAASNALGFVCLLPWLAGVTELVWRRARPDERLGRMAPWRHPRGGLVGRALDGLANSRLVRGLCEWLPPASFASDITEVIYVNYLVEADRLALLLPDGLELQRLGRDGRFALFTHLTYRHGHFGPRRLGPLRRLLPSPVHTNWRLYVRDPRGGRGGIWFLTNAIASTPHALAARLLSEGMPMHALASGDVDVAADGSVTVRLDPGQGSGPDLEARLRPGPAELPPGPWSECFTSYREFLAYCVPQDRALSVQPWYGRRTRQEIRLDIPLEVCEPLQGEVHSRAAHALAGDAVPICFRVPRVSFRFDREFRE